MFQFCKTIEIFLVVEPSSHNTSGVAVDDSLDDIINTLNKGGLTGPGEYEDTDK